MSEDKTVTPLAGKGKPPQSGGGVALPAHVAAEMKQREIQTVVRNRLALGIYQQMVANDQHTQLNDKQLEGMVRKSMAASEMFIVVTEGKF